MQGLQNSLFLKMKTWSSKLSWIKLTGETFKEIRSMIFFKRKFLNLLKTKMDYHPWQKASTILYDFKVAHSTQSIFVVSRLI